MTKNCVHSFGHSPVCQTLLQIVMRVVIMSSPCVWTGMLSTPANFPFFNDCTAASTSLRRKGWLSLCLSEGKCSTDWFLLALWLYSSKQYSVHQFSISNSSVMHFPEWSWTVVAFPCFIVVKSFWSWYALLLLFFLRNLQSHYTVFLPSFLCLFHAPLAVVVHFLVFLRSFRFTSFLSQFSPFVIQIKNFCSDPRFFLLMMFAKDLTGCFNHCCVEVICCGDHWIHVCIFSFHDSERCKLPAYQSLDYFQHIGLFQLFKSRV